MTPNETIAILRKFARAYRANEHIWGASLPGVPAEVGAAIESAIETIERMEKQKPVAWADAFGEPFRNRCEIDGVASPLYTLPGANRLPSFADAYQGAREEVAIWKRRALEAEDLNRKFIAEINGPMHMGEPAQPAPSVPDGWKLVPIEPTEKMINEGTCAASLPGPHYIDSACAKQCWANMIAAAPEAKP